MSSRSPNLNLRLLECTADTGFSRNHPATAIVCSISPTATTYSAGSMALHEGQRGLVGDGWAQKTVALEADIVK